MKNHDTGMRKIVSSSNWYVDKYSFLSKTGDLVKIPEMTFVYLWDGKIYNRVRVYQKGVSGNYEDHGHRYSYSTTKYLFRKIICGLRMDIPLDPYIEKGLAFHKVSTGE